MLDELLHQADCFIEKQAATGQPFFLYVPLTAPHKPVWPHPRFVGKTELGPYGDFVAQVNSLVGGILQSIDDCGVRDQTLVIYSSDNGSFMRRSADPNFVDHVLDERVQEQYRQSHHTANGPFEGTKADIYEAGHHVPFFARWSNKIAAGSQCTEVICLTDIFRTIADIVKGTPEKDAAPDSFSLWPSMQGQPATVRRAAVIHHSADGMFAIRDGKLPND